MFVDLVRASNDAAELGFVKDSRLLNVLITRQTLGFFLVADERCVMTLAQQIERDDPLPVAEGETFTEEQTAPDTEAAKTERKTPEDRKNATVIAIFDWMREKGRVINVAKESVTENYVDFPKPYEEPPEANWGDEPVKNSAPTNAPNSPDGKVNSGADDNGEYFNSDLQYGQDNLLGKEGEEVISGGDGDDVTDSYVQDDEEPAAGGSGEGGWVSAPADVEILGCW